jgi:transposase
VFVQLHVQLRLLPQPSRSVHSRYWRVLRDLPSHGKAVELHVAVRRFRCRDPNCIRKTYVESASCGGETHQTSRYSETLRMVGYVFGGEAGCRLAKRLGIRTRPDTALRKAKHKPIPESAPLKYIGVDDWGWLKGQRYRIDPIRSRDPPADRQVIR